MTQKLSTKLLLLIVIIGIVPLFLFGQYAVSTSLETTKQTTIEGHEQISKELSQRIFMHLTHSEAIVRSLAENFNNINSTDLQRHRVLRNIKLSFDEFRKFYIFDAAHNILATSELESTTATPNRLSDILDRTLSKSDADILLSDLFLSSDKVPTMYMAIPIYFFCSIREVLIAEVSLLQFWKSISEIKIGKSGFASIFTDKGKVLASGNGERKAEAVMLAKDINFAQYNAHSNKSLELTLNDGTNVLATITSIKSPYNWLVVIEQPTSEAFALALSLRNKLYLLTFLVLVVVLIVGYFISKREIMNPFNAIMKRIHEISEGKIEGAVHINTTGEFLELALTLNEMSEQMIVFQQKIVAEEKISVLGRVAAHLAHDLKHPIQNIDNYFKILMRDPANPEYMNLFTTTVKREMKKINIFFDNFKDLSKDMTFVPIISETAPIIEEVVAGIQAECERKRINIVTNLKYNPKITIDLLLMNRLLTNLTKNAIEAMPSGGTLSIEQYLTDEHLGFQKGALCLKITDTGIGIPEENFKNLFQDFMSTKSAGIGLGLAITKRIVQKHNGDIIVESKPNHGTSFFIYLPLSEK